MVAFADVCLVVLSVWLAYYLRIGDFIYLTRWTDEHFPLPAVAIGLLIIPLFSIFGMYRLSFPVCWVANTCDCGAGSHHLLDDKCDGDYPAWRPRHSSNHWHHSTTFSILQHNFSEIVYSSLAWARFRAVSS